MVPTTGIEPATPSLPWMCSTDWAMMAYIVFNYILNQENEEKKGKFNASKFRSKVSKATKISFASALLIVLGSCIGAGIFKSRSVLEGSGYYLTLAILHGFYLVLQLLQWLFLCLKFLQFLLIVIIR